MKLLTKLTQKELKEKYSYNSLTGEFTRLTSNNQVKVGAVANSKHHSGYIHIRFGKSKYQAHRLAWLYVYGEFPNGMLDHINGKRDDNRIANLRIASKSQNGINRNKSKSNTTGYRNVYFQEYDVDGYKISKPYTTSCTLNGSYHFLGSYTTAEEASEVFEEFAKILHGEFYRNPYPIIGSGGSEY
jgi:hypothetical protein